MTTTEYPLPVYIAYIDYKERVVVEEAMAKLYGVNKLRLEHRSAGSGYRNIVPRDLYSDTPEAALRNLRLGLTRQCLALEKKIATLKSQQAAIDDRIVDEAMKVKYD